MSVIKLTQTPIQGVVSFCQSEGSPGTSLSMPLLGLLFRSEGSTSPVNLWEKRDREPESVSSRPRDPVPTPLPLSQSFPPLSTYSSLRVSTPLDWFRTVPLPRSCPNISRFGPQVSLVTVGRGRVQVSYENRYVPKITVDDIHFNPFWQPFLSFVFMHFLDSLCWKG